MYKLFFLLSCWIFVTYGCQSIEQNLSIPVIEADVTSNAELKLSEYFENFRMLKLPTDSVMGEIHRIKYENNRIYISDEQTLFVFSDDGKLLSCFKKRGKGPGEYKKITDFMVDGETITVLDRDQQRLLAYEHSGKSTSTRSIGYYAQAISPVVDNSFFLYFFDSRFSHYLRRVKNGQEDSVYLSVNENQVKNNLLIFSDHNFYKYQKSIYFYKPINDTVYKSVGGGRISPFFCVDFKGKNIPAPFLKKQYNDVMVFANELYEKSYAHGIYNFALNDRFLIFNSNYQYNQKLTVYDRNNKISNTFATIKDDVYLNGLTIPVSEFIYHVDNHIFVPLGASDVLEWKQAHPPAEKFKEMVNTTNEGDNPLLLIFDFKQ